MRVLPIKWAVHSWTVAANTEHVSPWAHGCPTRSRCKTARLSQDTADDLQGSFLKAQRVLPLATGEETRKLWPPFLSVGETTFAAIFLSRQRTGKIRTSSGGPPFPMAGSTLMSVPEKPGRVCGDLRAPETAAVMGMTPSSAHLRIYLIRRIPKPHPPPAAAPSPRNSPENVGSQATPLTQPTAF